MNFQHCLLDFEGVMFLYMRRETVLTPCSFTNSSCKAYRIYGWTDLPLPWSAHHIVLITCISKIIWRSIYLGHCWWELGPVHPMSIPLRQSRYACRCTEPGTAPACPPWSWLCNPPLLGNLTSNMIWNSACLCLQQVPNKFSPSSSLLKRVDTIRVVTSVHCN